MTSAAVSAAMPTLEAPRSGLAGHKPEVVSTSDRHGPQLSTADSSGSIARASGNEA